MIVIMRSFSQGLLGLALLVFQATSVLAFQGAPIPTKAKTAYLDASSGGADFTVQGEYVGRREGHGRLGAQVVAEGDGRFVIQFLYGGLPGEGWDGKTKSKSVAKTMEERTIIDGGGWSGLIADGSLRGHDRDGSPFTLQRVVRTSPTEGLVPPPEAIVLFDGKDLAEWTNASMSEDHLLNVGTFTKRGFRDFTLHAEFRTPFMPFARGQGRGNSGFYLLRLYEVQVLDSFGLEGKANECGALYTKAAPNIHICYPPLSWQTYDITFRAPRFDTDGNKLDNAVITVRHNGILIHDEVVLRESTHKGYVEKDQLAPILLQNHGTPVQFRNIWLTVPKDDDR